MTGGALRRRCAAPGAAGLGWCLWARRGDAVQHRGTTPDAGQVSAQDRGGAGRGPAAMSPSSVGLQWHRVCRGATGWWHFATGEYAAAGHTFVQAQWLGLLRRRARLPAAVVACRSPSSGWPGWMPPQAAKVRDYARPRPFALCAAVHGLPVCPVGQPARGDVLQVRSGFARPGAALPC